MKSAPWTHLLLTLFLLEEGCCQQLAPPTGNLREGSRAISPPGRDLGGGKRASIQLVPHNSAFAFDLFRKVASCSSGENIFFSPLSISTAFAMLSLGARDATLTELFKGLDFAKLPVEEVHAGFRYLIHTLGQLNRNLRLNVGNVLFVEEQMRPLQYFLRDIRYWYAAEAIPTNFHDPLAARDQINGYVDQKTQGKIPDLIGNLDSESALVLASYIFFQAQWEKKFDPRQTQEDDFFLTEDKSIKVPMMYRGGMYRYGYDDQLSCTILEMPYKGNATGLFILPDERNLERVEAELQKDTVARWKKLITRRSIDVSLPKFSISGTYDLKPLLYKMGIMKVFTEYGELSKIAAQHSLKLTKAVHKAVLKIDEKGTEGAAGSSVEAMPMIMPSLVKFNQPFLVIITDDFTDSILFLGKVANPAGK
ncbi:serpin A12 isoform X1 [Ornithorhynchus anatinus]|uniref:Serpin family A member 12 n=1 Tax=Ornithorhynchus anatinus TaxID=9258 RepID=F7DEQ3_ORNAN|nr:serpin A12 isoform X1 [Ornithorhynchus anatinus]XP_028920665.1 serpin A12 isoform X1 [Ornithorhynchus anatinus]XP_028920673.1 serpin A12 isoform X1 [Ornithorhynchus anatinus]XP_028920682.1 serpin A12 isoform X1 [Ornithorhynchus anatinus]XP_028920710.1 serpin A12 isoform X1 [Ornithorhynchus anatinus]XP_028920715.1 serpin A12 isoform X1 [Ornithorhynchus anatinus]XP_039767904.1 serpin A12 isoform X1 [Ornithorhynchus anatinus]XP_039767920.1 serpin A12 isoform X1 [Ornithorhynchus anatinus]